MRLAALTAGLVAWIGAVLASLCCLLPLTLIGLGVGGGAFMATTTRYRWLLVPAGIAGVVAGFVLYIRERRRCDALACRMAGSRIALALLIVAALVVMAAVVFD
jgi:mercuric ion transport protein